MKTNREGFEELDMVATEVCDRLCKYPVIWDVDRFGLLIDSDVCDECPLVNLVKRTTVEEM